jgi:hypothetical protein
VAASKLSGEETAKWIVEQQQAGQFAPDQEGPVCEMHLQPLMLMKTQYNAELQLAPVLLLTQTNQLELLHEHLGPHQVRWSVQQRCCQEQWMHRSHQQQRNKLRPTFHHQQQHLPHQHQHQRQQYLQHLHPSHQHPLQMQLPQQDPQSKQS